MNYTLQADEVVLYEGEATSEDYKGNLVVTLTSQKLIIEKAPAIFKKERVLVDQISLADVKIYNGTVQIKQKGSCVEIQTVPKNITLEFDGLFEPRKFIGKFVDAVTGTTAAKRASDKTKDAFEMVDDTLGLDTRGTVKGVLEQGLLGTLINGIGKKKK